MQVADSRGTESAPSYTPPTPPTHSRTHPMITITTTTATTMEDMPSLLLLLRGSTGTFGLGAATALSFRTSVHVYWQGLRTLQASIADGRDEPIARDRFCSSGRRASHVVGGAIGVEVVHWTTIAIEDRSERPPAWLDIGQAIDGQSIFTDALVDTEVVEAHASCDQGGSSCKFDAQRTVEDRKALNENAESTLYGHPVRALLEVKDVIDSGGRDHAG